ncbi:hypothetical protein MUK42_32641 [Musa troglodytarum]|uniref:Uncharacterized protein n=1 Tax=Musa troglodytarum TaxID=320322 RepID=A0A9E7L6X7_9LILI|nr:hypothetical protein MUK42_32641 [Musa troglodytarum]
MPPSPLIFRPPKWVTTEEGVFAAGERVSIHRCSAALPKARVRHQERDRGRPIRTGVHVPW